MRLWAAIAATAAAIATLVLVGVQALPERTGPPIEVLVVERTDLSLGRIELTVRNVGPDPVQVAQVAVNDSFVEFIGAPEPIDRLDTATLTLSYPWQEGQPYTIALLTSTGVVIEHVVPAAVATPSPPASSGRWRCWASTSASSPSSSGCSCCRCCAVPGREPCGYSWR